MSRELHCCPENRCLLVYKLRALALSFCFFSLSSSDRTNISCWTEHRLIVPHPHNNHTNTQLLFRQLLCAGGILPEFPLQFLSPTFTT
jgi:hypothetical protein